MTTSKLIQHTTHPQRLHQRLPSPPKAPTTQSPWNTILPLIQFSDFAPQLWLTFLVHEQLNTKRGLPKFIEYGVIGLAHAGTPESEIQEYHTCRHAFPHVPQVLYPSTRPDGLPSSHINSHRPPDRPCDKTLTLLSDCC